MRQYNAIKAKYPGTILLFRVGDFYETFSSDAVEVSKVLGIVLTKRANGSASHIELAGFPHHSLDTYLPKLVRAGKRVAVCDQLEDPKQAKGIVKRGVTELVTPGVTFNDKVLEGDKHNYLASVYFPSNKEVGVAFLEISTGDFFCFSGYHQYAEKVLNTLSPSEIIVCRNDIKKFHALFGEKFYLTRLDDWVYQYDYSREKLLKLLDTTSLKGFGIEDETNGIVAAGAIVHYIHENQQTDLGHINKIYKFDDSAFVWLDQFTVRNLELVYPLHPDGASLIDIIDRTLTPMGARFLRRAILLPLKEVGAIQKRLDTVEVFIKNPNQSNDMYQLLRQLGDLERLVSKLATGKMNPKEASLMRLSLRCIRPILECLASYGDAHTNDIAEAFEDIQPALEAMDRYLKEDASPSLSDGNVICEGISEELDELRNIKSNSRELLLNMQQREIERTGISSLKIGFNKVFGYYLEVTNAHKDKAPEEWIRKQTLTNAERYITEELKIYEEKILNAEERIQSLEAGLYRDFILLMQNYILPIQHNGRKLAELDLYMSFGIIAKERGYVKPVVNDGELIDIEAGRHPVIESQLPSEQPYVPNDISLDRSHQQIIIVTGPNMAGKSALLRQTALVTLMAQIGCFVPADRAVIGVVDKIFTRVGASDNISSGESTFMVEMNETAQIANNATPRSLILLDEIGRGTSTYDGVSIAWALVEHLHDTESCQARTLFATHYHELNELTNRLERVKNFHVSVKEIDGRILFLRKLKKGGSAHSFGINVAAMAGMPGSLVERAKELLVHFEKNKLNDKESAKAIKFSSKQNIQLNMFELKDADTLKIREILSGCDIDRMTPVDALLKLQEIKGVLLED